MTTITRVCPVSLEERDRIKRARDAKARSRLPKDALGRTIVTQPGRHNQLR